MSNAIQTVDRVLRMLLAFDPDRRELGVSDFAGLLAVHKSTASRLAATLAARGFLERAPDGKLFRLGPELARLGLLASGGADLVALARAPMERLAARTGETVNLAVVDGHEAVNIAQADGPRIIGVGIWTGRRTKLHCTSNGKVFLAFAGSAVGRGELERRTPHTITSRKQLQAQLEQVRRDGWASNVGELEEGLGLGRKEIAQRRLPRFFCGQSEPTPATISRLPSYPHEQVMSWRTNPCPLANPWLLAGDAS